MKSAMLERMLLHSWATSIVTPGTDSTKPVPQHGSPHHPENEIGNLGRAFLQRVSHPVQNTPAGAEP